MCVEGPAAKTGGEVKLAMTRGPWVETLVARLTATFAKPPTVFMSEDERVAIEAALGLLQGPVRVLEWGSGGSTLHFGRLLPPGSSWHAIEHQRGWAARVRYEAQRQRLDHVTVEHVPSDEAHVEGSGDGTAHAFRSYVARPGAQGERLDFVIVDGRARVACLRHGWQLLTPRGIAALHDAQRSVYADARPPGSHRIRLRDPRTQLDGGDIELHFFLNDESLAERLARELASRLSPDVTVSRD